MRFTVEPWAPEYGSPSEAGLAEPAAPPVVDMEVPPAQWGPVTSSSAPAPSVLFVDGVRRVDASVWIDRPQDFPLLGLCATFAAGAVLCDGRAEVKATEVRRGLFTAAASDPIVTRFGEYQVCATAGSTPEELWLGIQQRMGELEGMVAARCDEAALTVLDGPLSHRRHVRGAVGYIKTHHVQYLPDELRPVLALLRAGERTPLFLISTSWSRYSWYLRLPGAGDTPAGGLARCEISSDSSASEAARVADLVSVTIPRFASQPHKEPRAPQNLYPIAGLERELRRRLGDERLLYRELRRAAGR